MKQIIEAFLNAAPNFIGDTLRIAVQENKVQEGMQLIIDQVNLGNEVEVEMTIGAKALQLINQFFKQ